MIKRMLVKKIQLLTLRRSYFILKRVIQSLTTKSVKIKVLRFWRKWAHFSKMIWKSLESKTGSLSFFRSHSGSNMKKTTTQYMTRFIIWIKKVISHSHLLHLSNSGHSQSLKDSTILRHLSILIIYMTNKSLLNTVFLLTCWGSCPCSKFIVWKQFWGNCWRVRCNLMVR